MKIQNKDKLRTMLKADKDFSLASKLGYLATYGAEDATTDLLVRGEDEISIVWLNAQGKAYMNGALIRHRDGSWSVHT